MPNRKIISFNVGSTHFMHFNRADRVTKGETVANKKKRSNLIKQIVLYPFSLNFFDKDFASSFLEQKIKPLEGLNREIISMKKDSMIIQQHLLDLKSKTSQRNSLLQKLFS